MLATSELIRETGQRGRLEELLPRWRNVPLYRPALSHPDFDFNRLPLIAKHEMRAGFPGNFLPENQSPVGNGAAVRLRSWRNASTRCGTSILPPNSVRRKRSGN